MFFVKSYDAKAYMVNWLNSTPIGYTMFNLVTLDLEITILSTRAK